MILEAQNAPIAAGTDEFCRFCGAGLPPKFGEGTCEKCNPEIYKKKRLSAKEEFIEIFATRLRSKRL